MEPYLRRSFVRRSCPPCATLCVRHWFGQELLTEALKRYATAPKLWMMAGQLAEDQGNVDGARGLYQRGTKLCPTSIPLWKLAARLEVRCFAAASLLHCVPTSHPPPVGVVVVVLVGVFAGEGRCWYEGASHPGVRPSAEPEEPGAVGRVCAPGAADGQREARDVAARPGPAGRNGWRCLHSVVAVLCCCACIVVVGHDILVGYHL